jgi:Tfp pilus assembly protein PilO
MKPLHSTATPVPWSRVVREHRKALVPLGIVLAVNLVLLLVVVLPLSRRVAANEQRAIMAARSATLAEAEFRRAEAVRDEQSRATADLETFYKEVLPGDVESARRTVQSKTMRVADAHDVEYRRGASNTEATRDSSLERFSYSMTLSGSYDDIRAFIYDLETAPEFVIIDNMVLAEGRDTNAPLSLGVELSTYYRARRASGSGGEAPSNGR